MFSFHKKTLSIISNICFSLAIVTSASAQPFTQASTARLSFGTFTGAVEPNAEVINPKMTKNGRFVVFQSAATNLVNTSSGLYSGFTNINGARNHIYLYDRQAGSLELITILANGSNAATISATNPVVSEDGRYVSYVANTTGAQAEALNPNIDGDFTNGNRCTVSDRRCHVDYWVDGTHVWVRDRLANKNFLASQVLMPVKVQKFLNGVPQTTTQKRCDAGHGGCGSIDCDVGFQEDVKIPVIEQINIKMAQGILVDRVPLNITAATAANPFMSGNGQFSLFDSDSNYLAGVVSGAEIPDPVCGVDYVKADNGIIPDLGNGSSFIAMPLEADYLDGNDTTRDVFVRNGESFTNQIASYGCSFHATNGCNVQGNQDAVKGAISDDGKKVVWQSNSTNLLDLDFSSFTDVYLSLRDSLSGEVSELQRISNTTNRITASNGESTAASISADGRFIAFQSTGSNIVTNDINSKADVFIYDTSFFTTVRCLSSSGTQGDGDSTAPSLTGAGESVAFASTSTNFGASSGFTNGFVGTLTKNDLGRLISCTVTLATPGSAGTGANAAISNISAGIVPVTSGTGSAKTRRRTTAVSYQSTATNLHTGSTDANATADVFQAPTCSDEDLNSDQDGDGTTDCFDQCWKDALKVEDVDTDADGAPDCEDVCASDAQKTTAGVCGCGVLDTDSDGDATPDCTDLCPTDANKIAVGSCGCGVADVDANGNGTIDCLESTNPTPTPNPLVPTATPTPGGTTTPTPAPTATPITFKDAVPSNPTLSTATNRRLIGGFSYDGLPDPTVSIEVQLQEKANPKNSSSKTKTTRTTKKDSITFKNLVRGYYYRIRFRAFNAAGASTAWSDYTAFRRVKG